MGCSRALGHIWFRHPGYLYGDVVRVQSHWVMPSAESGPGPLMYPNSESLSVLEQTLSIDVFSTENDVSMSKHIFLSTLGTQGDGDELLKDLIIAEANRCHLVCT